MRPSSISVRRSLQADGLAPLNEVYLRSTQLVVKSRLGSSVHRVAHIRIHSSPVHVSSSQNHIDLPAEHDPFGDVKCQLDLSGSRRCGSVQRWSILPSEILPSFSTRASISILSPLPLCEISANSSAWHRTSISRYSFHWFDHPTVCLHVRCHYPSDWEERCRCACHTIRGSIQYCDYFDYHGWRRQTCAVVGGWPNRLFDSRCSR